jgi:hypothetical protein|nr:MAG TPA: hypothetical protein [Caudoviricetes sp.]
MIILGTPKNIEDYYIADGEIAFMLHQAGFIPRYEDDGALFYKKNNKLLKFLAKHGIEV